MDIIGIMEGSLRGTHKKHWLSLLLIEKILIEKYFPWLNLIINYKSKSLVGKGTLIINNKRFNIVVSYSPYNVGRYDRIYIQDSNIKFNNNIHLYADKSLCLYHPIFDKPLFGYIPFIKMIPWITEWIVFYQQWKKYGVWFGDEIKH